MATENVQWSIMSLIISRIPKTCAILQLVSAPLNPIPIVDHFRRSHPLCELSYCTNVSIIGKENKIITVNNNIKYASNGIQKANISRTTS